jgi:nicotinamidase-related amidase
MATEDRTEGHRALLLVDLQNDYFESDELARCRDDLVAAVTELVGRAQAAGAPVLEVRTVHARDRSTWAINMLDDGQGMALEGSTGADRLAELPPVGEVVVKTRDSAFHGTDLAHRLRRLEVDEIVLAGVSTESCIAATAVDGYAHDFRVVLVEDATASVDAALHGATLERLREQYRHQVVPAGEVRF